MRNVHGPIEHDPVEGGQDPGALLEGEIRSRGLEDAEHWLRVYRELSEFAGRLASVEEAGERQRFLARRFQARLRYWEDRVRLLRSRWPG